MMRVKKIKINGKTEKPKVKPKVKKASPKKISPKKLKPKLCHMSNRNIGFINITTSDTEEGSGSLSRVNSRGLDRLDSHLDTHYTHHYLNN